MANPVLCVCKDVGGTNGIVPVHRALGAMGVPSVLIANGKVIAEGIPSAVLQADTLRAVYGAGVDVFPHPVTGLPVVAPSAADS